MWQRHTFVLAGRRRACLCGDLLRNNFVVEGLRVEMVQNALFRLRAWIHEEFKLRFRRRVHDNVSRRVVGDPVSFPGGELAGSVRLQILWFHPERLLRGTPWNRGRAGGGVVPWPA